MRYRRFRRAVCAILLVPAMAGSAVWTDYARGDAPMPDAEMLNPLVQQAVTDLAQRESVAAAAISLLSYEEVTWPDASLGCPRPGMRYKQVPQDGVRILLQLAGKTYAYHGGGGRSPFLCRQQATR